MLSVDVTLPPPSQRLPLVHFHSRSFIPSWNTATGASAYRSIASRRPKRCDDVEWPV